jgi:hypothetical protein
MKKQNQASLKDARTIRKTPQQKRRSRTTSILRLTGRGFRSWKKKHDHSAIDADQLISLGASIIAHHELAKLINRGARAENQPGATKEKRSSPVITGNLEHCRDYSVVNVEITEAQRVQLSTPVNFSTYRQFLRVATHKQLMTLRETVPLYWTLGEQSHAPQRLVSLCGKKPDGTGYVWLYVWMHRAILELSSELKRRGL